MRDCVIAHYKVGERADTPVWRHCRAMPIPDSLAERLALWEEDALWIEQPHDLFKEASWAAVLIGQGLVPRRHHPVADLAPAPALEAKLAELRAATAARAAALPDHQTYLAHCTDPVAA